jgi:hypothetical protein
VGTLKYINPGTQLLPNYGRGSLQTLREHQLMASPPPCDRKRTDNPPPSGPDSDLRQH